MAGFSCLLLASTDGGIAQDVLRGHGGPVRALAVRAETRELVSGAFDAAVIVWDLASGAAKRVLRVHSGPVAAVALLDGGCIASGGEDRRIVVSCGTEAQPRQAMEGHEGPIAALAAVGTGGLVSGSFDGTIRVWDTASGRQRAAIAGHTGPVTAVAAAGSGRLVSAGHDGLVLLHDMAAATPRASYAATAPINALARADDGGVALACADGHIRLLSPTLGLERDIDLDGGPLSAIALSGDGRLAAVAGLRGSVSVIQRADGHVVAHLTGPGLPVWSLAFDSDHRTLLTGGADRVIRRWDAVDGRPLSPIVPEPTVTTETERGAIVFRACRACHTLGPDDAPRAGPSLHGVFGRRIASVPGYSYSDALRRLDIVWSAETISRLFEIGPATFTPGTRMPEQTITDPDDRRALVEWLARASR